MSEVEIRMDPLLRNLQPVATAATIVIGIYNEAIRTGHLNPLELRRALVSLAKASMDADEDIKAATFSLHDV